MMDYVPASPPFIGKLRDMSKSDLRRYFEWFVSAIPVRVEQLERSVKRTPGYGKWHADCTPESLQALGDWFAHEVRTRTRGDDELHEFQDKLPPFVQLSRRDITDHTYSLALDVGMYFSQVMTRNHTSLRWEQIVNDKRFVDYGHPVLAGFANSPLNPVRICIVLARGLAEKTQSGRRLRELYDVWAKFIE